MSFSVDLLTALCFIDQQQQPQQYQNEIEKDGKCKIKASDWIYNSLSIILLTNYLGPIVQLNFAVCVSLSLCSSVEFFWYSHNGMNENDFCMPFIKYIGHCPLNLYLQSLTLLCSWTYLEILYSLSFNRCEPWNLWLFKMWSIVQYRHISCGNKQQFWTDFFPDFLSACTMQPKETRKNRLNFFNKYKMNNQP